MVSITVWEVEEEEEEGTCLVWEIPHKPLSQIALLLVIMFNVYLVHMLVHQLVLAITLTPCQGAFLVAVVSALTTNGNVDIVLAVLLT